ncbi:hypothetical protein D9M71_504250 [compost metagenome]
MQACLEVGPQVVQRYAFVKDPDLVAVRLRVKTVLPAGRRNRQVALLQVQQMQRITGTDTRVVVQASWKFGVEVSIRSLCVIVVLAEVHQRDIGINLLGIQRLAPPRMGKDDIRAIALPLQA